MKRFIIIALLFTLNLNGLEYPAPAAILNERVLKETFNLEKEKILFLSNLYKENSHSINSLLAREQLDESAISKLANGPIIKPILCKSFELKTEAEKTFDQLIKERIITNRQRKAILELKSKAIEHLLSCDQCSFEGFLTENENLVQEARKVYKRFMPILSKIYLANSDKINSILKSSTLEEVKLLKLIDDIIQKEFEEQYPFASLFISSKYALSLSPKVKAKVDYYKNSIKTILHKYFELKKEIWGQS